jgi:uncharacterized membrane protein YidH (DUF202 family)
VSAPGGAGERTSLAWSRTALAAAGYAALALRIGLAQQRALDLATATTAGLTAAVVWMAARRRRPGLAHAAIVTVAVCLTATATLTVAAMFS